MDDYHAPPELADAMHFEDPPDDSVHLPTDDPPTVDPPPPLEATPATTAPNSSAPPSTGRPASKAKPPPAPPVCQVEGCGAALEGLKDFHQRYKVCDVHLKAPDVQRNGAVVRFCQQCGRFQPLEDFDGKKRSCRAQLQRHNARRRKRPREPDTEVDAATALGLSAGIAPSDVHAMQEAMQFASATLMHSISGQGSGGTTAEVAAAMDPGSEAAAAAAGAAIAGMPFGGGLSTMPYVPSRNVMMLLLKGYAAMFHYVIDSMQLRPKEAVTPIADLAMPMEAAAAAAAAAMVASGIPGAPAPAQAPGVGGELASHLLAIPQLQTHPIPGAGQEGDDEEATTAAVAAAAAAAAAAGPDSYAMAGYGDDMMHIYTQQEAAAAAARAYVGEEDGGGMAAAATEPPHAPHEATVDAGQQTGPLHYQNGGQGNEGEVPGGA